MYDIEAIREALINLSAALAAAFTGRLAKHILMVQKGLRRFWGIQLLLELPVAIFMGFVGNGLADWMQLSPKSGIGLIAALSYLGPAAIEHVFSKMVSNAANEYHKKQ